MPFLLRWLLVAAGCLALGCVDARVGTLSYSSNPAVYAKGIGISPNTPSVQNATATTFAVSPALPPGLTLNSGTGILTGLPTQGTAQAFYVVTATTAKETLTCKLSITVNDPTILAILTQPADQAVLVGQTALFSVTAAGPGTLSYQWSKSGIPIAGATAATFITPPTTLADQGTRYSVVVTASLGGSLTSGDATLSVSASAPGIASATGSMADRRIYHATTLLGSGQVLVTGGFDGTTKATAELYSVATYTFTPTGSMTTGRQSHTATLLSGGKVLVAGGTRNNTPLATAELYDPASGTFTPAGAMTAARAFHTATLLPNGKVLLVGGRDASGIVGTAELYDPAANTFAATGPLLGEARDNHSATLLSTGKVLVAGGFRTSALSEAELYDPASGTFTATGSMVVPRSGHKEVLLPGPGGKVFLFGGSTSTTVEVFDPATGTFRATGSLLIPRSLSHTATLLATGDILVAGGLGPGPTLLADTELYHPASALSTASGPLGAARETHSAVLLTNGKVLLLGGFGAGGYLATAELYQ